jgi:Mce-associated membrane protein
VTDSDDEKTTPVVDETDAPEAAEAADDADVVDAEVVADGTSRSGIDWARVTAYGLLPALALILAMAAGFLKYVDNSVRESATARNESVRAATAGTIALLSYTPDKVDQQLNDARSLLTGEFLESYTSLINEVVIPGAKQQQISAVATVPKVGSVSADPRHAVVLVFVNQAVVVGTDAPTNTASSVRVTLEKTKDKWLISEFTPV